MREQFEKWYGENYSNYALKSWNGSCYTNFDTQMAWSSWKESNLIGWADGYDDGYNNGWTDAINIG